MLKKNDYQNYTLILSHKDRGSKTFTFEVIQPSDPTSPINLAVSYCSSSAAFITWTAGLSGNAPTKHQKFHILYNEWHSDRLKELKLNGSNFSKRVTNGSENEAVSAEINGLKPGTLYVFLLYAENDNGGKSNLSKSVLCTTKPLPQTNGTSLYEYRAEYSYILNKVYADYSIYTLYFMCN